VGTGADVERQTFPPSFDTLSAKVQSEMELYDRDYGTLADGLCISFYGTIELTGCVRDQAIRETFIVSQLKEDAILGMPFLKRHRFLIYFSKSAMLMASQELTCVDKFGRPLMGGVQVVRYRAAPGLPFSVESIIAKFPCWRWWKVHTKESNSPATSIS